MFESVEISPAVRSDPRLFESVERGTQMIGRIAEDEFRPNIRLNWDVQDDVAGGKRTVLTMRYKGEEMSTKLSAEDLRSAEKAESSFNILFGRLLQKRSRRLLKELKTDMALESVQ